MTVENPISSLLKDPDLLRHAPAKLRQDAVRYLATWESPELAISLLEELPASTQLSLWELRVELLCALGRAREAVAVARERLSLRPSATASCRLGKALYYAGDMKDAIELLDRLTKEMAGLVTVWGTLGDVLLATGGAVNAAACFEEILRLRPDSATGLRGLARCAMLAGDLARARSLMEAALGSREFPSTSLLKEAIGLYDRLGDSESVKRIREELARRKDATLAVLLKELGGSPEAAPTAAPPKPPGAKTELKRHGAHNIDPWDRLGENGPLPANAISVAAAEQPALPEAQHLLHEVFGHATFRHGQAAVIQNILQGRDTLAIMPTGSGKSLCYQLPALLLPKLTLVVSPLIALMKDQTDSLPPVVRNRTTLINSTLDRGELDRRLSEIVGRQYCLVYAAPERLRQRPFLHAIRQAGISLLVVDEAHCVSMWGHDFRPDYLFIAKAMAALGNPTLVAMTATATPEMAGEIVQQFVRPLQLVRTSMHRHNLRLEVCPCQNDDEKRRVLIEVCRQEQGSGIIYVNSREKAEDLADFLRKRGRTAALHYHAGMEKAEREAAQDRFMSGETRVMVATVAFGMGVDKEDVRFIVHFDLPRSLEGYSQEAGRAGRDGLPARCVLLFTTAARGLLTRWAKIDRLTLDELRAVYRALREQAGAGNAIVASSDLERALVESGGRENSESHARVAVSLLERAGLISRHFDLPRTSVVTLFDGPAGGSDADFERFVKSTRLPVGRPVDVRSLEAAHRSDIRPDEFEEKLLRWQEQGLLAYRGVGRDMHIQLLDPPSDSRERLEGLLERHAQTQEERIEEIVSYATTSRCRHEAMVAHFGEKLTSRCSACDRCSPGQPFTVRPAAAAPQKGQEVPPREAVVACLKSLPYAVGRTGLVRTLRGSIEAPFGGGRSPQFGVLAHVSKQKLENIIKAMIEDGTLETYERDGFPLLRVAPPPSAY